MMLFLIVFLFLSYRKSFKISLFVVILFIFPKEYIEFRRERAKMLHSRRNQLLLEFSFWNEPLPRPGPNIYELRTYHLKVFFLNLYDIETFMLNHEGLKDFAEQSSSFMLTLCSDIVDIQ